MIATHTLLTNCLSFTLSKAKKNTRNIENVANIAATAVTAADCSSCQSCSATLYAVAMLCLSNMLLVIATRIFAIANAAILVLVINIVHMYIVDLIAGAVVIVAVV